MPGSGTWAVRQLVWPKLRRLPLLHQALASHTQGRVPSEGARMCIT